LLQVRKAMNITNVVFTKNRPMQLHGYLESLRRFYSSDKIHTIVLYKEDLFGNEYEMLFREFSGITVVREQDFHSDFLRIISDINTEYVLFGVDDVLFFDSVPLKLIERAFNSHAKTMYGFSLRIGPNEQIKNDIDAGNLSKQRWDDQEYYLLDWTRGLSPVSSYPFELCATVYKTEEIRRLIECTMKGGPLMRRIFAPSSLATKIISKLYSRKKTLRLFGYFYNPNTFESWCCRYVKRHDDEFGHYLGFQKICASAVQLNLVNTSTNTDWEGDRDLTVEALNEHYKNGKKIDIDYLVDNKPRASHVEKEYFKII
jgi:hypothetical protein